MATQYDTQIQQLYVAYFNRPADASGIAHWANFMANGGTVAQISAAFATSLEYQVEYSQTTNAGIVTQVYQNLFGRAPDATGLAFWVQALTNKDMTVENMVTTIAAGAQGTDKVAFDSKVTVATAFTNALDTDAEKAGYAGTEANEAAKELLSTIKTAAQATAAIVPATLDASIAGVIKAGVPFTLEGGLTALGNAQEAIADFLADAVVLDATGEAIENPDADDVAAYVVSAEEAVAAQIDVGTYVPGDAEGTPAIPAIPDDPATPDVDESRPEVPAVPGGTLPGVKAALIAEQQAANAKALTTAEANLTTAQTAVSGVTGLNNAIAAATSAEEASIEAAQAAQIAVGTETAALNTLNVRNSTNFTVNVTADAITFTPKTGTPTPVVVAELEDGLWSIPTGVTAATYPGLTEAVAARNAVIATAVDAEEAAENYLFAQVEVEFRDRSTAGTAALEDIPFVSGEVTVGASGVPTIANIRDELAALRTDETGNAAAITTFLNAINTFLTQNDAARADDVVEAQEAVEAAQETIADFEEALANLEAAQALATELESLTEARDEALADFEANDYVEPSMITGAKFGTTGSDIFVFADTTATISSFGRSGDDVLYVGTGYTLNDGATDEGNNAVLEVFFNQRGANAEIIIETEAYGSDLAAGAGVKVITLTGVNVDDLTFENGIITL